MIVALRMSDEDFLPVVNITGPNLNEYCRYRGYVYCAYSYKHIDAKDRIEYFKTAEWKWYERILEIFEMPERPEWVWFSGADCLVMNMDTRLEDIISKYPGEIIVSSDQDGLSTHSTFFKNSHNVIQFLKQMLNERGNYENAQYYFQKNSHHSFINIVPQNVMNSYDREARGESKEMDGGFKEGDFILHFTCMTMEQRLERLGYWIGKVIKNIKHGQGCSCKLCQ